MRAKRPRSSLRGSCSQAASCVGFAGYLLPMAISSFIRALREKVGHDLLPLVGVSCVVINDSRHVLLVKSKECPTWMPIGGMVEVGEEPADTVVREVLEETGVEVEPQRLAGVFDGPDVTYRNGDRVHYVTLVFRCRPLRGEPRVNDDETTEVRSFSLDALPELRADHRRNIECVLRNTPEAAFSCRTPLSSKSC
jgi:ADP-ribose pyrophosphatase YjhB (NUDIX family)